VTGCFCRSGYGKRLASFPETQIGPSRIVYQRVALPALFLLLRLHVRVGPSLSLPRPPLPHGPWPSVLVEDSMIVARPWSSCAADRPSSNFLATDWFIFFKSRNSPLFPSPQFPVLWVKKIGYLIQSPLIPAMSISGLSAARFPCGCTPHPAPRLTSPGSAQPFSLSL